ncbi:pyoverdine/dityrosine biosynthesis protein [Colletotrichum sublineola]|uniref:Putative pyoverdine/dityrosine biosynthesis protein n=1 Tax=Colletotrichum sublineola TaxID=1173701 RepID=A0A066XNN5_COLSU|nr:pyoverdine/dityrosine biosynthesis protein [Colletotrichum sublineola]KDN67630.1 putative pyoverdine/dityrosine biosynthesis protein [Colletotrichum sublineola]
MLATATITTNPLIAEKPTFAFPPTLNLEEEFKNTVAKDAVIDATTEAVMNVLLSSSEIDTDEAALNAKDSFRPRIRQHMAANRQIPMVLPAFPGKSKNNTQKVLDIFPDLGEELALARLNDLCSQIKQLYKPGAKVIIAADGACYSDVLEYTDDHLWEYDVTLRQMVANAGYDCFEFVHFMNLVGTCSKSTMTKEEFFGLLKSSQQAMMEKYLPPDFDVDKAINSDSDMKSTYLAYCKFLTIDLSQPMKASGHSCKEVKRTVHSIAKTLISRGAAFAEALRQRYPDCVRLSIHSSNGKTKIPIRLIPSPDPVSMTPWHCVVAVDVYGAFRTGHAATWKNTHDLVYKDGRPYYFRERSPLYNWDAKVEFEHCYNGGLVVHNAGGAEQTKESLSAADKEKAVSLALLQGKIVLQGF